MAMNGYESPGAAFGSGMEEFLQQQAALKRQAMLDQLQQQRESRLDRSSEEDLAIRRMEAQNRLDASKDTLQQKKVAGAEKTIGGLQMGDMLTPDMQKVITEAGLPLEQLAPKVPAAPVGPPTPEGMETRTFAGSPLERRAQKFSEQTAGLDPSSDEYKRLLAQIEIESGKAPTAGIVAPDKPTSQPVMRVNPKTGQVEQIGTAPTGAHIVREPTPAPPVAHYTDQAEVDKDGKPTGRMFRIDSLTGAVSLAPSDVGPVVTKAPPGASTIAPKAQAKADAVTTLGHLDTDIDDANAKGLIGPAAGRISDLELAVGNADPIISRLATRMTLAKMQLDAGLGGTRAAASPLLLARWDHLLAAKATAENLHEVVKVMRDIVGGANPNDSASTKKPTAAELIKKYGG